MGLWDLFGITEILNGPSPNSNNLPPKFGSQYNSGSRGYAGVVTRTVDTPAATDTSREKADYSTRKASVSNFRCYQFFSFDVFKITIQTNTLS